MRNILVKKVIRKENGAISTLVLFTVLVFVVILMGSYLSVTSLEKSQLKSDEKIQEIYGKGVTQVDLIYDELMTKYAKYDEPYIPMGFTYKEGTWNSGYTIKQDILGNEFVWVPCVTDQAKVKPGDTVVTFGKTLPQTTATTDSNYMYNINNLTIIDNENITEKIKTSVEKYGGFYIAKYEAGIQGTKDNYNLGTKTKTDGSVKPLSQAGKGVWNYISREDAVIVSESMIKTTDGVKSTLISGECWDTTLQWMVKTSENATKEPNLGYDINSTGKGWYKDVSNTVSHTTGYYQINNIYDMAGNVWEWTTENCTNNGISYLVRRGGDYYNTGSTTPAGYRSFTSDSANDGSAFRVVLYK